MIAYCFEDSFVRETLKRMKTKDLAVIDPDGISKNTIQAAVKHGVFVYGYVNVGALESGRTYYNSLKDLRIDHYEGWSGEFWINPTSQKWKDHIYATAKDQKDKGAIGVYLDNTDIYYMCCGHLQGKYSKVPDREKVYKSLVEMVQGIHDLGIIVMPNGGDTFVRRMFQKDNGKKYIPTINQEGVLYQDFKANNSADRKYYTEYVDWAKKQGCYIRGIEYVKTATGIAKCKAYYALHGWQGLYISKHTELRGD